ncbi:MAG: tyrosine-type recombinase/integrase [Sulfurimonas sp.]|uniref:tyrosine-type recombinase/integrase n=1 Tax=Sulfurimonas sp. TaxID=2022749 RepID=UPI00260B5256|nr:site-specific integrase [Sulfurimonas sp.]MDD5400245.1 tyrosine-type recombinase/integrase [Sulfurimonas sp.]
MRKLRFKNRNGILYFGFGDNLKSSKMKYSNVNKNIIIGKFKSGDLDVELGINEVKQVPTVAILLDEVMNGKSKVLKHKTLLAYKVTCRNLIIPYFKDVLVTQIKPIDIKKFQDALVDKGLGKGSLNLTRVLLKEVFSLAILKELVILNPIKMVDMPKFRIANDKKKQKPCTLDEIDEILTNTQEAVKNFLGIAFFSGMRSGEILALKWEDIDFVTDTISINKTIAEGYINSPKTASSLRDIEMLPQAKKFLKAQRLLTGLKNDFVFVNKKGSYYGSNTHFYNHFQKVLKNLNFEQRSLHNTRHTFASMMLNNGIDPLWVSHTLGHENLQITLNTYTHYMPKKEKMSIGFLEKRYKNGTERI